ncbi:MAG: FkbM family methyltransferase [Opitutaceae bacterium]
MAQVSRIVRRAFLRALPESTRIGLLERHPKLRRAAPPGLQLRFENFLGEFNVEIDTRFPVERKMWSGDYDRALQRLLREWIRPDSTCLDIGANVGAITLAMAQCLKGGAGRVYAFEPAPPTYARLTANIALNPAVCDRIIPVNLGLGDKPGTLRWSEEVDNLGNGSLLAGSESCGIAVEVTTLDAFCMQHAIDRVDVIKIDVESMEYDVFLGSDTVLRRHRPKIFFETMARSKRIRGADIFEKIERWLSERGFALFRPDRHGNLSPTTAAHLGNNTVALPR